MPVHRTTIRQESPELAEAGARLLQECFARIESFPERFEVHKIEPESRLAEANRWTEAVDPFSSQVMHLAVSAQQHLHFLSSYMSTTHDAPTMGGYTLARSAIESSAVGLWLLNAGTLNARVISSLRLSWRNAVDTEEFAAASGVAEPENLAEFRTRVEACRDARKSLTGKSIDWFPPWSKIVRESDRWGIRTHAITAIQAWKMGSGFVHANRNLTVQVLEHRLEGDGYRMATRLSTLAKVVEKATDHTESLLDHLDRSATAPGQRSN
ncbi:hypothetical protein J7E25_00605 [Agromyces sp. ISL-38]|uniref:hypothetical protein n=1 Tax=Agromyces sp. ISL-38 TaxID=2819107 RepID=UPI001BEA66D0|nr:hypothetical protein [Agromyces sp. ISL-38]MBT2497591.1 hypothetical protein [Agromyces sp. ISL-38]